LGLLGNIYQGEKRSQALGYTASTLTIAGIVFPLLAGWVGAIHWQLAFCVYGLGIPLALLAGLILPEKRQIPALPQTKTDFSKLRTVLGEPHTRRLLLTLSLASVAMYAVLIYAPLYFQETIGIGSALNGVILATRGIGAAAISAFGAQWLAQTLGTAPATALGFGLMAVTLLTIPILNQLSWILLAAVFFGVGFGIVLPTLYSTLASLAPSNLKSSVLAAGTGAGFLGQFLSPILLGPVLSYSGLEAVFYVAAIITLTTGLFLFAPTQKGFV